MPYLAGARCAILIVALISGSASAADWKFEVETDPAALLLNGGSLHVGARQEHWRLELGYYRADLPHWAHNNDGLDASMAGGGIKLQYFLREDGTGAFVGTGVGRVRRNVRDKAGVAAQLRTWHSDAGLEGGYRFAMGAHAYVTPWAGLDWISRHEDSFVGGKRYRQKAVMPFAAIHLGYRF